MALPEGTRDAIAAHQAAGRRFDAGGVQSFVRDEGRGGCVVLLHGVPSSSYVFRRVVPELARQGLRAVAPDLPGLGLADRPDEDFDLSWSGLARWLGEALDALEVDRCHLVVHDLGGPIGFEWAIRHPDRVLSVTALNTFVDVAGHRAPWTMRPFATRGLGELWLAAMRPRIATLLVYRQGIADRAAVPREEALGHYYLLKRIDGGRAFLRIMRGYEATAEKEAFLREGLAERDYPAQVVWGERDPALGPDRLRAVCEMLAVEHPTLLPAKHFLTEDQPRAVANAIADLAAPLG